MPVGVYDVRPLVGEEVQPSAQATVDAADRTANNKEKKSTMLWSSIGSRARFRLWPVA